MLSMPLGVEVLRLRSANIHEKSCSPAMQHGGLVVWRVAGKSALTAAFKVTVGVVTYSALVYLPA